MDFKITPVVATAVAALILCFILLVLVTLPRPVTHGPVYYEDKIIDSLTSIDPGSVLFVHLKSPVPGQITVGVTTPEGVPLVYPLYDEEIARSGDEILLAISCYPEILDRVVTGQVKVLAYPTSRINTLLIAETRLVNFKILDGALRPVHVEHWRAWTYKAHSTVDGATVNPNQEYPVITRVGAWIPPRVVLKPYRAVRGFSPVNTFQNPPNTRFFLKVRTFDLLWPGSTLFSHRAKNLVMFPYHPRARLLVDDEEVGFLKPDGNDWVYANITTGQRCKVVFYNLHLDPLVYFS